MRTQPKPPLVSESNEFEVQPSASGGPLPNFLRRVREVSSSLVVSKYDDDEDGEFDDDEFGEDEANVLRGLLSYRGTPVSASRTLQRQLVPGSERSRRRRNAPRSAPVAFPGFDASAPPSPAAPNGDLMSAVHELRAEMTRMRGELERLQKVPHVDDLPAPPPPPPPTTVHVRGDEDHELRAEMMRMRGELERVQKVPDVDDLPAPPQNPSQVASRARRTQASIESSALRSRLAKHREELESLLDEHSDLVELGITSPASVPNGTLTPTRLARASANRAMHESASLRQAAQSKSHDLDGADVPHGRPPRPRSFQNDALDPSSPDFRKALASWGLSS